MSKRSLHEFIVADLMAEGRTREQAEALLERDKYAITWQPKIDEDDDE